MRINRLWALGGLGLALSASVALAQVGGNGTKVNGQFTGQRVAGVSITDTSTRVMLTDANGRPQVTESNPLSAQYVVIPIVTGGVTDTTAVGMADSSAVQTQYPGYIVHGIYIRPSLPGPGAPPFCRVAFSLRTHINGLSDSINTVPISIRRVVQTASTSVDSLVYGNTTSPTSTVTADHEAVYTFARTDAGAAKWTQGYGRYIPLVGADGQALRLNNFSVLWRVLSASANTNSFVIYVYATALR